MSPVIRLGACLGMAAALVFAENPIRLKTRSLEPAEDRYGHLVGPLKRRFPGRSHYLLQFREPPGPKQLERIRERGGIVTSRVPENALMVAAGDDFNTGGLDVRWAGRLRYEDKLSPALRAADPLLEIPVTAAYVVEFHPDVNMEEARRLAEEHLLEVIENGDLLPHQLLVEGYYDEVAALADWDEVAYIFPASDDLRDGMPVAGCAGAMLAEGPVGQYVLMSQGWPSLGGGDIQLGWALRNSPAHIGVSAARAEIERALAEWSQYAKVSFVPGWSGARRTIDILFGRSNHGDQYPFDGPGRVLAHTFYPSPPNPETIAGDMHLDADEDWQIGRTVDLYTVVLHELGHALGLGHSDQPGSVMYPYYRSASGLAPDDIAGIRALYGKREANSDPPTSPADPEPSPEPPQKPSDPPREPERPQESDTAPPALSITSPGSTMVSSTSPTITLRGMSSDQGGVTAVKWTNSTGAAGDASGTTFWTATVPLQTGRNAITIRAFDAAGNSSWRSVTVVKR